MILTNSIKQILRQFKSSGRYTLFNLLGLTLGLSMTILMVLLLVYELSFDCFHPNADKILCIGTHDLKDGSYRATTACPLAQTLKDDFSEVKYVAGFNNILGKEAEVNYNDLSYSGFTGASVVIPVIFLKYSSSVPLKQSKTVKCVL